LEQIKNDLTVDYGSEKEWLKLKDVCVEKNEGE
jgi:protein kinase C substrate 80K-H